MGVEIDETRSDDPALGVEFFGTTSRDLAERDDTSLGDGDIGVAWLTARAVEDRPIADDKIETVVHGACSVVRRH